MQFKQNKDESFSPLIAPPGTSEHENTISARGSHKTTPYMKYLAFCVVRFVFVLWD